MSCSEVKRYGHNGVSGRGGKVSSRRRGGDGRVATDGGKGRARVVIVSKVRKKIKKRCTRVSINFIIS